jgi:hypothetical protein
MESLLIIEIAAAMVLGGAAIGLVDEQPGCFALIVTAALALVLIQLLM